MKKKGEAGLLETIVFLILNLVFFSVMGYFVYNSGSQTFIFEQAYAKQLALIIDNSKPEMVVMMNLDEIMPIAIEKNVPLNQIFSIDDKNNLVIVRLNSNGGYNYHYFTNNLVKLEVKDNWLVISISKKGEIV